MNVICTIGHDVQIGSGAILSPHVNMNDTSVLGKVPFLAARVTVDLRVHIGRF